MVRVGLTDQSVLEAGIAAHLSANPNLLPPAISELSDQAAIFASNNVNAFMFTGSADSDSENTNFGEALATKAIEKVIELEERRRKDDDPAGDASMIAELAARQREATARFTDGHFYFRGMKLTTDEMNEALRVTRENLPEIARREGWSDEQLAREESRLDEAIAETDPHRKAQLIGEIEQDNPAIANDLENSADMVLQNRPDNALTNDEAAQRQVNSIDDVNEYQEAALEVLDSTDTAEMALEARSGAVSVAGSTDLANSFEAGFSATPAFNDQASGSPQIVQAEPVQSSPSLSGPALS